MNLRFKKGIDNKGFAAVLTVIIISISALIMAQNTASLGIGDLDLGFNYTLGDKAFSIAEGCMNSVISQIRRESTYGLSGTINLNILDGSCVVDVTDAGSDRNIIVTGSTGTHQRSLEVDLTISSNTVTINSWKEISN